jgi:hypothetical protein
MTAKVSEKNGFSLRAFQGDAKTLLAEGRDDVPDRVHNPGCAGRPAGVLPAQHVVVQEPGEHAQVAAEPATSSINAPIHKFRWLHVPGSFHQGDKPLLGRYRYTVTPRYFDDSQSLLSIDTSRSVSVDIDVVPFRKKNLQLGFTRGFTQSQAFVHHFGAGRRQYPAR